jgi:uncharacterized protein YacL
MTLFIRLVGAALGVIVAIAIVGMAPADLFDMNGAGGVVLLGAWIVAWAVLGFAALPYVTVQPARWLIKHVVELSTGEFVSATIGLLLGLLIGVLLGLPLANFPPPAGWLLPLGVAIVFGLGMMGITVAKRGDLMDALRNSGMFPAAAEPASVDQSAAGPVIYADTSALIDGRIADVVASGFLWGTLVCPRFVIDELQSIADHRDLSRRSRGRRGLEILTMLQKDQRITIEMSDDDVPELPAVDAKLVELARRRGAAMLTNDYNLNRVAQLHEVRVLNLNHLANALKPAFLPGEELRVRVIQPGKEPGQGLAYLDDGTMIVVEGGGSFMAQELDVRVVRVLQTVAGRMVFAEPRAGS